MRATKVKGALICPVCSEIVDPDEHAVPEGMMTWKCPDCEHVADPEEYVDQRTCHHDPPEVVTELCPACEVWVETQEFVERKQCPLCEEWIDPADQDFDETEAFKCGECDQIYEDRDEAKECCRG